MTTSDARLVESIIGRDRLDDPDLVQKLLFGVIEGDEARGVAIHLAGERARLRGQIAEKDRALTALYRRLERAEEMLAYAADYNLPQHLRDLLAPWRRTWD